MHKGLNLALRKLRLSDDSRMMQLQACYRESRKCINELKLLQKQASFRNWDEQLHYFKEILPGFIQQLIYYGEYLRIETARPVGLNGIQEDYQRSTLELLQRFFERNAFLYQYYRMGRTELDEKLFVPGNHDLELFPEGAPLLDTEFCAGGSYLFGWFRAYESLISDLQRSGEPSDHAPNPGASVQRPPLHWTASKAALVELIYALQALGAVNYGQSAHQVLVERFEEVFDIQLGNIYRSFYDLSIRKKSRTPFLGRLRDALEQRMEEAHE